MRLLSFAFTIIFVRTGPRGFGTTYVLRTSSITYMSWKVPTLALESYCHGKFNFRLAFVGLKLPLSFLSSVLTSKSYLINKYSNFKIIV